MKQAEFDPVMISVTELHEYPGNPNEQDPVTFNNLVEEIEEDGFQEPIIVVPRENIEGPGHEGYTIVSGNHRFKASMVLDAEEVPCFVMDWDAEKSKIKVVRRNLLRGEVDPKKFTKLVQSFGEQYSQDELADMMGFKDIESFEKLYASELAGADAEGDQGAADAKDEMNLIDGLSLILNRLFSEYGETVPHSFMFFLYGSKIHLVAQANTKLKKMLELITQRCVDDALDINLVLTGLLGLGMKATNFEEGPPEHQDIEDSAREDEDEEHELQPVVGDPA